MTEVNEFVTKSKELLRLEQEGERDAIQGQLRSLSAKECENEGLSLLSLELDQIRTGLYGRNVVCLRRAKGTPFHRPHPSKWVMR